MWCLTTLLTLFVNEMHIVILIIDAYIVQIPNTIDARSIITALPPCFIVVQSHPH